MTAGYSSADVGSYGITYWFRIAAMHNDGSSSNWSMASATAAGPTTTVTPVATIVAPDEIDISLDVTNDDLWAYQLLYGTLSNDGMANMSQVFARSLDNGFTQQFHVTPGVHYYFTLVATQSFGNEAVATTTVEATVSGSTDPAPVSPAFAHAVYDPSVAGGQVKLSWANSSSDETGFTVYRSYKGGPYQLIKTVDADVTTYIDKPTNNGPWTYEIYAIKGVAVSPLAATASATAIGGPDVSAHLLKIRKDLFDWYAGLSDADKATFKNEWDTSILMEVQDGLVGNQNRAQRQSTIWDIWALKNQVVQTPHNLGVLPDRVNISSMYGSYRTVTVAGGVYSQEEVNYWLFGSLGALLGWGKSDVEHLIQFYRSFAPWNGTGVPGRIAWFEAGYDNDLTLPRNVTIGLLSGSGKSIQYFSYSSIPDVAPASPPPAGEDPGPLRYEAGYDPVRRTSAK